MVSINPIRLIVVFLLIAFNLQVALSAEDDDCDAYNSPSKIYMIPMTELIKLTIPELENATAIVRQRYLEIKGEYDAGASELLFVLEAEANLKQMQQALDSKRKNSNSPVKLPETAQAICYSVPLYQQPNAAFNRFNLNELENIQRLLENKLKEYKGRYQAGAMTMLPLTIVEADYNKMVKLIIARKKNDMAIAECPAPRSNVPLFLQPAATLAQISINDLRDIRRVLSLQAEYAKQSNSFDQTGVPMLDAINADLAQINAALAIKQKAESLTQEQAEKLADRIIKNIYRTDYKTNIEWLVLESIKDNPAILNAAVLEKIKKKYQVFNSTDDIPEKFRGYGPNNKYDGYNRGIIFKYKITFNSTDTVTVDFEMYIAPLNAGGWDWQYKWNGKEWIDNPRDASTIKMWAA